MKKITEQEIRDLLIQVMLGEISLSEMVEVIDEMVNPSEVIEFKDGDFVDGLGCIFILHKQIDKYSAQYHVLYSKISGMLLYDNAYSQLGGIDKIRLATEAEKQELLDALAKEGKRWNTKKLCVEDIPVRKFKKGDKVRIKRGVSSKTHGNIDPFFAEDMDDLIGKTMTVDRYTNRDNYVKCEGIYWSFHEEWLKPYVEELKEGDLAIFWDNSKEHAIIRVYKQFRMGTLFPHQDYMESGWANAIKFESKEQYEKLIKGDI